MRQALTSLLKHPGVKYFSYLMPKPSPSRSLLSFLITVLTGISQEINTRLSSTICSLDTILRENRRFPPVFDTLLHFHHPLHYRKTGCSRSALQGLPSFLSTSLLAYFMDIENLRTSLPKALE